jgi:hypothetical protein
MRNANALRLFLAIREDADNEARRNNGKKFNGVHKGFLFFPEWRGL